MLREHADMPSAFGDPGRGEDLGIHAPQKPEHPTNRDEHVVTAQPPAFMQAVQLKLQSLLTIRTNRATPRAP